MFQGLHLFGSMNAVRCTQRGKGSNQHWSFALIWYRQWWLPATGFHMAWNVGPPFWTWIRVAIGGMVLHNIPNKEKLLRMLSQQEKLWLKSVGMRNVLLFWISCLRGQQWTDTGPLKCWDFWRLTVIKFIYKCQKCCCSIMMTPGHTQVCTPMMQSHNLDKQCCHTQNAVLTLHHYISISLILLTFISWMGHPCPIKCKFLQTNG